MRQLRDVKGVEWRVDVNIKRLVGALRAGFIEHEQYETLLAAMPDHLKCPLVLAYHFGFRVGEIRKLKWSQVDFGSSEIRLSADQTKGKSGRVAPFYGQVREWLERQRLLCTGDLVCCWRKCGLGHNLNGWKEACASAGMNGLHFHDLRRSAVRNMERAGVSRSVAMRLSGHKTESVYNKRYDIVSAGDFRDAARKLESYQKSQTSPDKYPEMQP